MQFCFLKADLPAVLVEPIHVLTGFQKEYSGGSTSGEVGIAVNYYLPI